ncbi:acyl-CoA synthetase [soil metagenome]
MLAFLKQVQLHRDRIAVMQGSKRHTYSDLLTFSGRIANQLLNGRQDLKEARIAFMVKPGVDYVSTLWGIWRAGGVAVPLCLDHPLPSLQYVLEDTGAEIVIVSDELENILLDWCREKQVTVLPVSHIPIDIHSFTEPSIDSSRRAMILYTSGTTNLPKGVVTTHLNLEAQISTLVQAWQWTNKDHILCVLPLHHVHGIVNVVCCSLWSGACCEFLQGSFSALTVFSLFNEGKINVFMAVPTIYFKLIAYWEGIPDVEREQLASVLRRFRLMVSGSAALPVSVMKKWFDISDHMLLERYGMTEIGMAISNPYQGERRPGHVGMPLQGVKIRLCDELDRPIADGPGEIQVKGGNVFSEYWRNPEATVKSFTHDGWFKTGDVAELNEGYYKILGRNSVDIIKSGGYKISALEIEEVLRQHLQVKDCSVIGIDNEEWGEVVAAIYISEELLDKEHLTTWLGQRLPRYKVPRLYLRIDELPRNGMGKVIKGELKKYFQSA